MDIVHDTNRRTIDRRVVSMEIRHAGQLAAAIKVPSLLINN
jgi:hypothetical protein